MERWHDFFHLQMDHPTAVTVGKFDGLHLGHDLLLSRILGKEPALTSLMITFPVSPRVELLEEKNENLITSAERAYIVSRKGLSLLLECPFDERFIHLSPEEFIRELSLRLHMRYLAVGSDFRFGYKGAGDKDLILKLGEKYGYEADIVDKLKVDGLPVSSTLIREEIRKGQIDEADRLLGYPYFIWGEVVHGKRIGTGMGIPTINQVPPRDKLLPPNGVYVTEVEISGHLYHGITNVGVKPTVKTDKAVNVETHILDFKEDVYAKEAKVSFLHFVRPEQRFDSLSSLKAQIERDVHTAIRFFNA